MAKKPTPATFIKDPLWYKDAVIYQVHVKSYFDSNNDGIGDFPGLIAKLDYIADLGVNTIWLLPFYPSPRRDDGYDIAEYRGVHSDYGTMADAKRFIAEAHKRGLRVITELVINHTSDQHPWFQRARKAKPGSAARDFYVWSDDDQKYDGTRIIFLDTEKSNWTWDPVAGQYFWHRFYSHQPDLNFDNPQVMKAVLSVMRYWLDMGIDGLRLDAIPYLIERDGTNNENLPETHEVLKQIRAEIDAHYPDRMLLAEANQNLVSRWGHSMLRLVICAPGRPRGPDCRLDLDQHLVLSYRAFVGDVQLSSWDGLIGKYPSRLFVLPLSQVIDEYTKTELRGLASVPLKLTRQEINDTVEHAAEMHWSYDGNYFFISNNCAVESLKLLRSGSANPQLTGLDNITPNGLLEVLKGRGLADTSVLDDKKRALRLGYHFDSFRERYQAMFEVLKKRLPIKQAEVEDWLSLSAEERRPWFAEADLRASAALLLLEQASFRKQLMLAQDEVKQRYLGARELKNGGMEKANATLQQILANSGFLSRPAELLGTSGYGLPQPTESKRLESESAARQKQLQSLTGDLDKEVRALLEPARAAEIAAMDRLKSFKYRRLKSFYRNIIASPSPT